MQSCGQAPAGCGIGRDSAADLRRQTDDGLVADIALTGSIARAESSECEGAHLPANKKTRWKRARFAIRRRLDTQHRSIGEGLGTTAPASKRAHPPSPAKVERRAATLVELDEEKWGTDSTLVIPL